MAQRELLEREAARRASRRGQTVSTSSSPGSSAVVKCVTKNSSAASSRRPPGPATTTEPPSAGEAERQLRGRVGVGDRAADGAAVARREVPDEREGLRDERQAGARVAEASSADWRTIAPTRTAPPSTAIRSRPATRFRSTSARRPREPHVEQRHEALPAGERLRVLAVLGEQRERLVDATRGRA